MLIHRVPSDVWFRKTSQMFHLEELHPALGQWYFGCSVDGNFSIVSHPNVFLLTCVNDSEPTQVLIGENLVIAAVGQASATLLFQGGDAIPLAPGIDLQHAMFSVATS